MYKFNYTNETVSGLLRDKIHVPIYKNFSYALKVQIMIEMYICTSRFDNLRQAIIYYKRMIKIKAKQLVFLPFY